MKDKKEYGPVDMLKELRENDEARYPANTTHRPGKRTVMTGMPGTQTERGEATKPMWLMWNHTPTLT